MNLKKSVLHPVKQNRENVFGSFREKIKGCVSTMPGDLHATKSSVLNLTKLIGLLSSTVQIILQARIQFRYLKQQQILDLEKKEP